uniref:Uncharacterized protein n=1 Tax=Ciona savignyi TaxID=51511 RepID=H2YL16_CIOSA
MKGSAGGVKDAENNGLVGTIEEDLDKLLLVIENVEKSLTLRKNSLSSYSNINEKNGNRFLEDAECNTDDANKTVNQNRSNSNFQPLTKFKERQPNVLSQCSMQLRNEDVLDGNDFRQYFEFPPKMVSLPNSNIWFMNKTVDYDHNKPPIPPKTSYSSNQPDIGVVSPDKASPKTVTDCNSSFSPILLRSSLVKTKTAGMCGAYKYSDCELDLDDGLVCQDKMTNGFTRSGVYKDNKTFQVDLNPARNKSAETIQFTSSQNTVPDTNIIPESSSAINIAVPTLKNMDISRKSSKPGRFPTNAVSLSVSSSKDTIQPKHDYNKINSTGPYDNLLPGKSEVKLKP